MTTFVASLFLPYTINFHDVPAEEQRRPPPPPRTLTEVGRLGHNITNEVRPEVQRQATLFPKTAQTPPRTPAAVEYADFFAVQPSAATHFPKPFDPRTLVRSDSHIPEWSTTSVYFNQPQSRADPAPPENVLEYNKAKERADAAQLRRKLSPRNRQASRSSSSAARWSTSWNVVPAVRGNGGLNNAVNSSIKAGSLSDVLSVGLIGFPTDVLNKEKKDAIESTLETEHNAIPVFVSDSDLDGHYAHYCKTILWPVFHYQIPDHPKSKAYEDHSWCYYVNLNQAFADKIIANYKRGDIIWVHDYHLCLVPAMIRKKLPDAQIGFFLHAAFPSSEVFRCLATRKALLEGMLGANLVAFQTQEYAHHFLQTCSRILSVEATDDGIQLESNFVNVWSLPIGINPKELDQERAEQEVLDWIEALKKRYEGKKLIVARDPLDGIRGVRQKLLAYELFLNKNPEWKDKVVLIQVATPATDNDDLAATVSEIVTRIDAVHTTLSHSPLVFLRQDIAWSQYLALLSVADVLMVTSLREGMNLTCHEYIFCQDGKYSENKHNPIVLSEFTGSASIFDGAELIINPWDYQKCADAIKSALEMEDEEKNDRYFRVRDKVLNHTGDYWVTQLGKHLARVHDEHFRRDTMSIPRLNTSKLVEAYQNSSKRLFLLDYEGTLTPYGRVDSTVVTSPKAVTDTLRDLLADDRNIVYVMSCLPINDLERLLGHVPGVGLIAENGCYLREMYTDVWTEFIDKEKTAMWIESVKTILQYYLERVENSWIEQRECSLIFHFKKTDEYDAAARHAGDCANHINDACESMRVKAIPTKNSVIIEPMDLDKATAAKRILHSLEDDKRPDFLMVAGNDRDDEVVFRWAKTVEEQRIIPSVHTVIVSNRNTVAMATLPQGTTGLINALNKLTK
ncbi:alpha,alpha-trehalose phosphate synthase-like protein subunit [Dendryphion nanum]|uniref:Alpha,alpha-trehalose phosphate synthase-like protein subunit n=1 Tax=Dendryphion nanum TaxID=256645 RepID=A0A9P9E8G9_9PLEO|nr:alpha,alpha-trehalose phosphate synthase-like protein subunit [Dendryphion nanum]